MISYATAQSGKETLIPTTMIHTQEIRRKVRWGGTVAKCIHYKSKQQNDRLHSKSSPLDAKQNKSSKEGEGI